MRPRSRFVAALLTVSLAPLATAGLLANANAEATVTEGVLNHLNSVASIQESRIEGIVSQNIERLALVSSRTTLRTTLENYSRDPRIEYVVRMNQILLDARSSVSSFRDLSVLSLNGSVAASTNSTLIGTNRSSEEFYARAQVEPNADIFYVDPFWGLGVYLAGPLYLNSTLIGVIRIDSDVATILSLVSDYDGLGETGEMILAKRDVNGDGLFLAPTRFNPSAALNFVVSGSKIDAPVTLAVSGNETLLVSAIDYRGELVLAATRFISATGWGLVVKIDRLEAFAPVAELRVGLASIVLPTGFAVVLVSFLVARAVTRTEETRARLAAIVESSDDAIVGQTLDGTIVNWNAGAERLYGYAPDEVLGKSITVLVPSDRPNEAQGILGKLKKGLPVEHFETVRTRKDGTGVDVFLTVSPVRSTSGKLIGVSAIARDITERKRVERELAGQRRELERSNAELEQFAYVASHDLQEPLRMVASYSQLLERRYRGRLDADADEFIGFMGDGARRMQALIDDLLAYARVGTRGKELVATDSGAAMDQATSNLSKAIEESGAIVTRDPLPTLKADTSQLVQLFQNLIGNAVKYRGESPPRVHVGATRHEADWVFSVRDNGIGIDPKQHERIFLMFQRLHGRTEYPGMGIGLAISKKIVERHGGRIWVESQPGQGSIFYFMIPAGEVDR